MVESGFKITKALADVKELRPDKLMERGRDEGKGREGEKHFCSSFFSLQKSYLYQLIFFISHQFDIKA